MSLSRIVKRVAVPAVLALAAGAHAAPYVTAPGGQVGQTLQAVVGDTNPADGFDADNGFYLLDFQVHFDPLVFAYVANSETALPNAGLSASDYAVGITLTAPGELHGVVLVTGLPDGGPLAQFGFVALSTTAGGPGAAGLVLTPTPGTPNYGQLEVVAPPDWTTSAGPITSAVPEPASWAMALLGALALPALARRQRRPD